MKPTHMSDLPTLAPCACLSTSCCQSCMRSQSWSTARAGRHLDRFAHARGRGWGAIRARNGGCRAHAFLLAPTLLVHNCATDISCAERGAPAEARIEPTRLCMRKHSAVTRDPTLVISQAAPQARETVQREQPACQRAARPLRRRRCIAGSPATPAQREDHTAYEFQ
jgi:hypothetical protein